MIITVIKFTDYDMAFFISSAFSLTIYVSFSVTVGLYLCRFFCYHGG